MNFCVPVFTDDTTVVIVGALYFFTDVSNFNFKKKIYFSKMTFSTYTIDTSISLTPFLCEGARG
jgi:hypothetical protein